MLRAEGERTSVTPVILVKPVSFSRERSLSGMLRSVNSSPTEGDTLSQLLATLWGRDPEALEPPRLKLLLTMLGGADGRGHCKGGGASIGGEAHCKHCTFSRREKGLATLTFPRASFQMVSRRSVGNES